MGSPRPPMDTPLNLYTAVTLTKNLYMVRFTHAITNVVNVMQSINHLEQLFAITQDTLAIILNEPSNHQVFPCLFN